MATGPGTCAVCPGVAGAQETHHTQCAECADGGRSRPHPARHEGPEPPPCRHNGCSAAPGGAWSTRGSFFLPYCGSVLPSLLHEWVMTWDSAPPPSAPAAVVTCRPVLPGCRRHTPAASRRWPGSDSQDRLVALVSGSGSRRGVASRDWALESCCQYGNRRTIMISQMWPCGCQGLVWGRP